MSTSGDVFKSIAKGFGREFVRTGGAVIKGVPVKPIAKADIPGRETWGRKPVKPNPVPQKVDTSAFAKKYSLNRIEADRWLKKDVVSKDLVNKFIRYYPKKAGETDWQRAQRIERGLFGGVKDPASPHAGPIGPYIEKGADKYKLIERRKELLKSMRTERNFRQKERKKLDISIFDRFTGNTKK